MRRVDVTDKDDKQYLADGRDVPSGDNPRVKGIEFKGQTSLAGKSLLEFWSLGP